MSNKFKAMSAALKGRLTEPSSEELEQQVEKPENRRRRGGKRSDPHFIQVGVYIPKDLHHAVKRHLLDNKEMDFSDLVTELLTKWEERLTG